MKGTCGDIIVESNPTSSGLITRYQRLPRTVRANRAGEGTISGPLNDIEIKADLRFSIPHFGCLGYFDFCKLATEGGRTIERAHGIIPYPYYSLGMLAAGQGTKEGTKIIRKQFQAVRRQFAKCSPTPITATGATKALRWRWFHVESHMKNASRRIIICPHRF